MRQLATIQKISKIEKHPNADLLEIAIVKGWRCVVKKDEFKENDLVVYIEIDSLIPDSPQKSEFEFLRKSGIKTNADGSTGFRIRTIKLRGQISQGLILSLNILYSVSTKINISPSSDEPFYSYFINDIQLNGPYDDWNDELLGQDVTDYLGIKKYEPPIPAQLAGKVKGMFPGFIKKTDQERIQNITELFTNYPEVEFEVTEKLDGSSCTYYNYKDQFGVCSRNLELIEEEGNTLWKIANILNMKELLSGKNLAIQGEIIGEGVQGNPYKLKGQEFRVFDIWDIDKGWHFTSDERLNFILSSQLKHVPVIENSNKTPLKIALDELLKLAEGKSMLNESVEREGLVFKSLYTHYGQIISFKVINNKYLLEEKQ